MKYLHYNNHGSSLIELLVILTLLSSSFYLALDYLQDLKANQQTKNIADRLESILIYSKNQAIFTNETVTLCSTTDGKTCDAQKSRKTKWQLNWLVTKDSTSIEESNNNNKILYLSINKARFIQISYNNSSEIKFNNMGRCLKPGTFSINYNDGSFSKNYEIVISSAGRIRQVKN